VLITRARAGNDLVYWPTLFLMAKRLEYLGRHFVNGRLNDVRFLQPQLLLNSNRADGSFRVKINNAPPGEYQLRVLNSKEEVVYLEVVQMKEGSFQKTLRLYHLPKGVYPVVLINKQGHVEKRRQMVVTR